VASYYLDEHVGYSLVAPLLALGHDALATRQAGNHGLTDPRQLLFARHHGRIMVSFNDADYAMLHETLILWAAIGTLSGSPLHAGIALLPSSSRVAPDLLITALDELSRSAVDFRNRCFRWVPATGWQEVVVIPFTP
jgi:hypothetical protein